MEFGAMWILVLGGEREGLGGVLEHGCNEVRSVSGKGKMGLAGVLAGRGELGRVKVENKVLLPD